MYVPRDAFNRNDILVKLCIDQFIDGKPLKAGDTVDLSANEANYLRSVKRVEFVNADDENALTRGGVKFVTDPQQSVKDSKAPTAAAVAAAARPVKE